ncbi:OmpL47-type beta-barrel domain-containing protein [Cohnella kolymensis]|uniref:OmpL47-type beta-barrel domain-containing protein n=1 Tax=Cohnella kolymensis TaxID=1590652 RepID=UPI00069919BD|nr:hypothetical protein [Cohnella kolymensis]
MSKNELQSYILLANFTHTIANGNDVTLKWNSVTYATAYKIYQIVDGEPILKSTVTTTSKTFINLPEGDYIYEVHSFSDRFGESSGSELTFSLVFPIMQAPANLTQSVTNGNDITLRWTAATYANKYNVYQIIDGAPVLKTTVNGTSATFTNSPEGDYKYEVRSFSDRFGESAEVSEVSLSLVFPIMQAPANPTSTITNGNDITLRWTASTYATGYNVYQVVAGQKLLVKTQTGISVSFTNMPEGDYSYEIHSYSTRFGESPAPAVVNFNLTWPVVQPPVLAGAVFNANNITFTWKTVTWATEYRLYEVTGNTRTLVYKGNALTYKVYNLSEDTHHYELTAFNTRFGESAASNRYSETIVYPVMQPPVASLKLLSDTSARISWGFVTYANGYNVYEIVDGKPVLLVENLNNLSYTLTNLTYADHEYVVTSYSNSFGESDKSNIVLARLIIDTTAPVTAANAPAAWTNQDAVVTLTATDDETGVKETYYAVNDQEYTAGTSLTVTEEGVTKVSFYSVDKVGNKEAVKSIDVKIDKSAPVTRASETAEWSKAAIVQLSVEDTHSGVAKTLYSVNGSDYVEGTSIKLEQAGVNRISFYSVDTAGNSEEAQTIEVKIDAVAPVTISNALQGWTQEDVTVSLSATDAHSGVVKTLYSVNGSAYLEGTSFTIDAEGISQVTFYSVDAAGNSEQAQTIEVKIDRTAPVTAFKAPAGWTKQAAFVTLAATDEHSGTDKTFYSINGSEFVEGTSFTIDKEGVNQVSFYSVDAAGNSEKAQSAEVKIDSTAPVTASNAPEGWSKEDVMVSLKASDALSGVKQTYYSVDGSEYAAGTAVQVTGEGVHKLTFYSIDEAGNIEAASSADVKIDETAPIVSMNLNGEYSLGESLTLTYTATDNLSGIAVEKMTVSGPQSGADTVVANGGAFKPDKPGIYNIIVTVTNGAGLTTTIKKQLTVYIAATIEVTPKVIKGNNGVFTVRVDLPDGFSTQGFDLNKATLNGVKALSSNNGYYNQAKNGQFKFERSDFKWTGSEVVLQFRGYANGYLVVGQTTVKVQK